MFYGWTAIEACEHAISLRGRYVRGLVVNSQNSIRSRTVCGNSHERILGAVFGGVVEDLDERQRKQLRVTSNFAGLGRYRYVDAHGFELRCAFIQSRLNQSSDIDDLLMKVKTERKTTKVIVTHDIHGARKIADKFAVLDQGRVLAFGTPEELDRRNDSRLNQFISER